jgi:hypothetical protein
MRAPTIEEIQEAVERKEEPMRAPTIEEIQTAVDSLERKGKIVRVGMTRDGQPTYKLTETATEEELRAARKRKN